MKKAVILKKIAHSVLRKITKKQKKQKIVRKIPFTKLVKSDNIVAPEINPLDKKTKREGKG